MLKCKMTECIRIHQTFHSPKQRRLAPLKQLQQRLPLKDARLEEMETWEGRQLKLSVYSLEKARLTS